MNDLSIHTGIHGSLHGHSNQPNEETCAISLRGIVFSLLLCNILSSLSGKPNVDIYKDDNLNIMKCLEEVNGDCGVVIHWYSMIKMLPGISVEVSDFLQLYMKGEYNQCFRLKPA